MTNLNASIRFGLLCIWSLLAGLPPASAQVGAEKLQAGAARRELVPPFLTRMPGYFDRTDTFIGVESPIYARSLVCDNGETRLAIVATDLIGVPRELVEEVRAIVEGKTGIPRENILVSASHNHSAVAGYQPRFMFGAPYDPLLYDFLLTEISQSILDANENLKPARIGFGSGELVGFSRNRQQGNDLVVDPEVGVLKIQEADSREPIATLFNFTGHPVVLGETNLYLSSEYPGHAERMVEEVLGGVAMFTQGACGDVTVHRQGPPMEEIQRLGRILGSEVIKTSEMTQAVPDNRLFSKFEGVRVGLRHLPSGEEAQRLFDTSDEAFKNAKESHSPEKELNRLERQRDSDEMTLHLVQFLSDKPRAQEKAAQASVHVMQVGPLILVGIPGELFVEYALEMKQRVRELRDQPMMLVGFANDYIGYIVTPRAIYTGGYEQSVTRVDSNAGRLLTETAMRIVEDSMD
ncbi:MAG: neutral/alkaline non-lysosomal ceramidase N-terminal domain-containing protein [Candidatus Omnitrophica bacterium]|nr:neutral/alkaline non-lysosomal ceramidase N-terminal domain-containing protein [Candidatus Omnitrophota bacterium]